MQIKCGAFGRQLVGLPAEISQNAGEGVLGKALHYWTRFLLRQAVGPSHGLYKQPAVRASRVNLRDGCSRSRFLLRQAVWTSNPRPHGFFIFALDVPGELMGRWGVEGCGMIFRVLMEAVMKREFGWVC